MISTRLSLQAHVCHFELDVTVYLASHKNNVTLLVLLVWEFAIFYAGSKDVVKFHQHVFYDGLQKQRKEIEELECYREHILLLPFLCQSNG